MPTLELKPNHKPVQHYYTALRQLDDLRASHEGAAKSAFHGLLDPCACQLDWKRDSSQSQRRWWVPRQP